METDNKKKEAVTDISEGASKAICILIYTGIVAVLIGLAIFKIFCK